MSPEDRLDLRFVGFLVAAILLLVGAGCMIAGGYKYDNPKDYSAAKPENQKLLIKEYKENAKRLMIWGGGFTLVGGIVGAIVKIRY